MFILDVGDQKNAAARTCILIMHECICDDRKVTVNVMKASTTQALLLSFHSN